MLTLVSIPPDTLAALSLKTPACASTSFFGQDLPFAWAKQSPNHSQPSTSHHVPLTSIHPLTNLEEGNGPSQGIGRHKECMDGPKAAAAATTATAGPGSVVQGGDKEREAFERRWKLSQAEDLYRTFSRLHPDSFKALVPVYNHQVRPGGMPDVF